MFFTVLFIFLCIGVGYFVLQFFSRLSGVEIFSAILWGFKAKQFALVLPLIPLYFMAFVFTFGLINQPVSLLTASATQIGGLSGYKDDDNTYAYYDPQQRGYSRIKTYSPPPDPENLNETFSVVSFYKPVLADYYQNVYKFQLLSSLLGLFFFFCGIIPLYFLMLALANDFNSSNGIKEKINFGIINGNFAELTRISFPAFIVAALIVIVIATISANVVSGNLLREQEIVSGRYSAEYRGRIMSAVSPGKIITGRIIRREQESEKVYLTQEESRRTMSSKNESRYEPAYNYIVEFPGLLEIPVYLKMRLRGDSETNPKIRELDALFANTKVVRTMYGSYSPDTHPVTMKDLEFLVNPDYSVALSSAGNH